MESTELRFSFLRKLQELMLDEVLMEDLDRIYVPLANMIAEGLNIEDKMQLIGVNGAQGAGKTTFGNLLKVVLEEKFKMKVLLLSIDDLYLTRAKREQLAKEVHPLLITRGVPGTHDVELGIRTIDSLAEASPKTVTKIPRFNKATDDQWPEASWDKFEGRPDVVLFDGWFMGASEQPEADLGEPINSLEELEDRDCVWRKYVNNQLKERYKELFNKLDLLVMLQVPSFEKVYEWRSLQERKLRMTTLGQKNLRVMGEFELRRFISHYERLTRFMLKELPDRVDMLFKVNDNHRIYI